MARILVNTRVWSVELFYVKNTLEQGKFWKFSKTAKPKVKEKVMESHGNWRTHKSMNPGKDPCIVQT